LAHDNTEQYFVLNAEFLVILGLLMGMLGLIAAAAPFAAGLAVELVVGVMVLCRGSMHFYYGIKVRHWGEVLGSYMGLGSIIMSFVSVACGVLLLLHPIAGVASLTLFLAAYLVIAGAFDILHAFELRAVTGWPLMALNGCAGIILGVLIWLQWPLSGSYAIGLIFGASLMLSGACLVGLGFRARWVRIQRSR